MDGKYCVHCGAVIEVAETIGRAKHEKPLSFAAFYKQKSNNRMMEYQKREKNVWRKKDAVLIHASLLLALKGSIDTRTWFLIALTVNVSWDHIDLKKTIFDKFKQYNAEVKKFDLSDVKLVNKSGEMVCFIPGKNIHLTVRA